MTPSTDLVPAKQTIPLAELAATANREHQQTLGAASVFLQHALACGEALKQAREQIAPGEWKAWCADNIETDHSTVMKYIRIAIYKADLIALDIDSVTNAMAYLQRYPALDNRFRSPSAIDIVEAKLLREQGLNYREIAEILGVSETTARLQLHPGERKKKKERDIRYMKRRREAQRALAAKERDEAVRKAGGNPAEAYSLLRRCALLLDSAMAEADDNEQRQVLREALASTHKAEEHIVRALRIG